MTIQYIENSNKPFIIGADEVGYGALSGPLVVCGVRAPKNWFIDGLGDSKKLSAKKREIMRDKLNILIEKKEIEWHLAERSNNHIDKHGVAVSLKDAYVEVFTNLYGSDCLIISDGILKFDNPLVANYDMVSLIKADSKIPTVMAASILAKTYRDAKMKGFHLLHPNYGWDSNVGYGSRDHLEAISKYGPSPLHRFSYAPMKNMKVDDPRQLKLFGN